MEEAPTRLRRAENVLNKRCGNVLLVLDKVCDKHNIQAVTRTAEALGVQNLWMVASRYVKHREATEHTVEEAELPSSNPPEAQIVGKLHNYLKDHGYANPSYIIENLAPRGCGDLWRVKCTMYNGETYVGTPDHTKKVAMRYAACEAMTALVPSYKPPKAAVLVVKAPKERKNPCTTSVTKGAERWLSIRNFETTDECIEALKKDGWTVWATDLSREALELNNSIPEEVVPEKLAVVMGSEASGVSDEMLAFATRRIYLPMSGFTESLNISVATALVLQRVLDCKKDSAGSLVSSEMDALRGQWWDLLAATKTARENFEEFAPFFKQSKLAPLPDIREERKPLKPLASPLPSTSSLSSHAAPLAIGVVVGMALQRLLAPKQ
eukprot:TRINITY_DN33932_c0_g1_i1.p1 TRINITY_DN33932_c0_g1~~TRINITY_DN33932_c0_g1_i1.p1  ORF type:complete len:396 (+),score=90.77 TRINITY_DN33932_c0_g1_i1:48-1190(+)